MKQVLKKILEIIVDAGYEAYLVGGYPRDCYRNVETSDYDVATSATPEELKTLFPNLDDTDSSYGRVSIRLEDCLVEITTFRKDFFYEEHRFPQKVIYVKNLSEDLLRRDFVMNTLCMDQDENFIDLLGAKKDIDQKIIRAVGNPFSKMEEDALRILRAIRFATVLDFQIDLELKQAMKQYKNYIHKLSYFRKKEELNRIFMSEHVKKGIDLLKEFELEDELEVYGFETLNPSTSLLGIWAQLDFSSCYEFSKQEKREIEKIRELLKKNVLDSFVLYQYGVYDCGIVAEIKGISKNQVIEHYRSLPIHHRNEIALSPKELESLVGKNLMGAVYEDLEHQILNGMLENLKIFVKKYVIQKYNGRNE